MAAPGSVPRLYPHDRLRELRAVAEAVPGGLVDCSVGTPVDAMPEVAQHALADAAAGATGYPPAIGSPAYREAAAAWIGRRFDVAVSPDAVLACIRTKEPVASPPPLPSLRGPSPATRPHPGVPYPTYQSGAPPAR